MVHPSLKVDSLAGTLFRSQRIGSQNIVGIGINISLVNQGIMSGSGKNDISVSVAEYGFLSGPSLLKENIIHESI